jgi:hypothetical protein
LERVFTNFLSTPFTNMLMYSARRRHSNSTARAANFWWNTGAWKLKAAGR